MLVAGGVLLTGGVVTGGVVGAAGSVTGVCTGTTRVPDVDSKFISEGEA